MWRTDSLEKTLMLETIEGRKRRGRQRMRWLDASPTRWTWVSTSSGGWWWTGRPGMLQSMELQRVRQDWETELNLANNNSSTTIFFFFNSTSFFLFFTLENTDILLRANFCGALTMSALNHASTVPFNPHNSPIAKPWGIFNIRLVLTLFNTRLRFTL